MNFRRLSDAQLADFAANVNDVLKGTALTSIDMNVRTELTAAFGTLPETLATQTAEAVIAEAERKSRVSTRNATRTLLYTLLGRVRGGLRAGLADKGQYDLCGFDFPTSPSPYQAQEPTGLSASGTSNGVNSLRFSGNNQPGRVVYEVWRRQGDAGVWQMHGTTKRQSFTDSGVTPGQYYEYKVRAVAARSVSNYSNSAVVYGVI